MGPYTRRVSMKPGVIRGGASGNATWITSAAIVTPIIQVRRLRYHSG